MKKWLVGATLTLGCVLLQMPLSAQYGATFIGNSNCCPLFRGFYVGCHFGFADYRADRSDSDNFITNGTSTHEDLSWAAGVQLGYDRLFCCNQYLLGLVADWDWTNAHNHLRPFSGNTFELAGSKLYTDLHWFSTIRARTGFVCNDSVLFYITAGAAVSRISTQTRLVESGISLADFKFHRTRWGWTAGFGTEFAAWCRWTVNAELLYIRYRQTSTHVIAPTFTSSGIVFNPVDIQWSDQNWVGRIGLNYRFSL